MVLDPLALPSTSPLTSVILTSLPLTTRTPPVKSLVAVVSVMLFADPAVRSVVPVTNNAPAWVMVPFAMAVRLPLMVLDPFVLPSTSPLVSVILTSLPLTTRTPPVKSLVAVVSVMLFADPAVRSVVPVTNNAPAWVMVPFAMAVRLPLMVLDPLALPSTSPLVSVIWTLFPLTTRTPPVKSLVAVVRVMSFAAPAVKSVVPVIAKAPPWVIGPPATTVRAPLATLEPSALPSISAFLSVI